MNAKFKHSYKKASSNPKTLGQVIDVNVYTVTGTADELVKYKASQGEAFREDEEGNNLWFTTKVLPPTVKLGISQKTQKVYADTSEGDRINTLANQYQGPLGTAIAQIGARQIMDRIFGTSQPAQPATVENAPGAPASGLEE